MKHTLLSLVAFFALSLVSWSAFAQTRVRIIKGEDKIVYQKKTVVDFENSNVDGELVKPEGSYMIQRNRSKFNSLIRYRSNFVPEMLKNARKI